VPEIEKEYIATGKVKYVLLDYPLPFHKNASKAAEAAHCAGEQGKYWEMHDQMFANQKAIDPKDLSEYAKAIGIDVSKFQQCLDSGKYADAIKKNIAEGQKAGVTGAPGFFLGNTDPNKPNTVKATKMIKGAVPYSKFKETIDSLLSPQK
jgi:protein-disulfide isomerase